MVVYARVGFFVSEANGICEHEQEVRKKTRVDVACSTLLCSGLRQAFFLEDVLVQTDYLKEIGADTGGGGGLLGGTGLEGLDEAVGEDSFECVLCGKAGFRYAVLLIAWAV